MKKIVTGVLMFLMAAVLSACGSMMISESRSPYDFDTTVATIMHNVENEGWSVPRVYDFRQILLAKGGEDIGNIKVIKLCNSDMAGSMLSSDETKFVGAMMPCSISIYDKADGLTYVSHMNMGLMSRMFSGHVGATMKKVAVVDERILAFLDS
jgi:uncharacterized protein (DUF302 family)